MNSNEYDNKPSILSVLFHSKALPCFIWGAICLLMLCFLAGFEICASAQCTEKVDAVVVEYVKIEPSSSGGRRKSNTYAPVYQYTYNGTEYTTRSNFASDTHPFDVGDRIVLRVDPDKPDSVYAPGDRSNKGGIAVLGGIASLMIIMGIVRMKKAGKELAMQDEEESWQPY